MNRKAQHAPTMFDLLLTVVIAGILLTGTGIFLIGGNTQANKKSLEYTSKFNKMDSAVNNLKVQAQIGPGVDITKIDEKIKNSKVLGGTTITNCRDYQKKEDCDQDLVNLHKGKSMFCKWGNNQCDLQVPQTKIK